MHVQCNGMIRPGAKRGAKKGAQARFKGRRAGKSDLLQNLDIGFDRHGVFLEADIACGSMHCGQDLACGWRRRKVILLIQICSMQGIIFCAAGCSKQGPAACLLRTKISRYQNHV